MAPKKYPRAHALLEKFHAGKCTPEELALLDSWYDGLQNIEPMPAADVSQYQQQFLANFRSRLPVAKVVWWKKAAVKWTAAAASVLLLAGAGFVWLQHSTASGDKSATDKTFLVTNETSAVKLVVLPDSSHVWLNTAASLRWKEDFNRKVRSVQLTGEGFFDVQGQTGKPFTIHTRDMAIQVLGTQFNVEAYPAEGLTRVSLVQGKVKVRVGKENAVLKPGYAAAYNNGEKGLTVSEADAGRVAAWREDAFSATDLPLHDAFARLCNRNGYTVRWENMQGADKNISVMFRKEAFTKMLDNLCYISRKRYRITEKQVTIY
ncbi:MAG: FecR family protein [Chitinophaga sp.]|uniref:FecR family protein n=1 Tax=Chitinophaga sp. TaxID=1869181 RepID=UPI001AFCD58C|nr:FecR family protein [Chitinophaga sp.]MBO9730703.1 FecR family protein [Chitinophaga sp.]